MQAASAPGDGADALEGLVLAGGFWGVSPQSWLRVFQVLAVSLGVLWPGCPLVASMAGAPPSSLDAWAVA